MFSLPGSGIYDLSSLKEQAGVEHSCDYSTPCHLVGGESISAGVLSKILFEVLFEAWGLL